MSFHLAVEFGEKLLPLYFFAAMGFVAGRCLELDRGTVAKLLIYVFVPLTFFLSVLKADLSGARLFLPLVFLCLGSILSISFYKFFGSRWKNPDKNILSFMVGSANTGYFGIPLIIALWGIDRVPNAIMIIFGYNLFEYTVGFYLTARGHSSPRDALKRVVRLPALHAFVLACVLNKMGFERNAFLENITVSLTQLYSVLGLMMIGLGLSKVHLEHIDFSFVGITVFYKFLIWPLLMLSVIYLDKHYLGIYSEQDHQTLTILSVVPLAANGVVLATELRASPEKAALSIMFSTVLALFLLPIFIAWMI